MLRGRGKEGVAEPLDSPPPSRGQGGSADAVQAGPLPGHQESGKVWRLSLEGTEQNWLSMDQDSLLLPGAKNPRYLPSVPTTSLCPWMDTAHASCLPPHLWVLILFAALLPRSAHAVIMDGKAKGDFQSSLLLLTA